MISASPSFLRRLGALCAAGLVAVSLSGCGEARKAMGFEKSAPDEFAVVARAPLSLPPDFQLRPPQPGAVRPQEGTARDQARSALTGQRPVDDGSRSPGLVALLNKAGADRAPGDIRSTINRELAALAQEEESFTDRLVFWRGPETPGTLVDPAKEAQRIRSNQALGTAVTQGDTPMIERRRKGLLEGLF